MDISLILIVLGVIFVSMTLHELMHGIVASYLGDDTAGLLGRLTLNPLKHIDPFMTILLPMIITVTNGLTGAATPIFGGAKPVPFNPNKIKFGEWGVALMAISGPLVNLFLAIVFYGVMTLIDPASGSILEKIMVVAVSVNLGFFAFNIIPIPPLDGSRVLYAVAPDMVRRWFDAIERFGPVLIFAIVLMAGPLVYQYMSFIISGILSILQAIF